jgi:hypothetical protein
LKKVDYGEQKLLGGKDLNNYNIYYKSREFVSNMILRKSIAIGIIALFIGMVFTPISGATVKETETMIPVEFTVLNADGSIGTTVMDISQTMLEELIDIVENLKDGNDEDLILEKLSTLFSSRQAKGLEGVINLDFLDNLPGSPILSYGKGRSLFSRYHGRVMVKRLANIWNYQSNLGATVIWGDGFTSAPTQILIKRQIGFMVGFVGLYMYIPPFVKGMQSSTFFMGSTMFAYGISL